MAGTEAHLTASLKGALLMLLICIHICSINVFSLYVRILFIKGLLTVNINSSTMKWPIGLKN